MNKTTEFTQEELDFLAANVVLRKTDVDTKLDSPGIIVIANVNGNVIRNVIGDLNCGVNGSVNGSITHDVRGHVGGVVLGVVLGNTSEVMSDPKYDGPESNNLK